MKIGSKMFALAVASVLIVAVVATNLQQASAFIIEGGKDFKKLTHEYEKNVITTIKEGPQPHLGELLTAYVDDVNRIFLEGQTLYHH